MNLLAIDTSTTSCSVALLEDERLVAEVVYTAGKTHSRHLMVLVQAILERANLVLHNVDAIAVTKGPGTFTGLRIGLSTVKGLALATGASVVGVSSIDALVFPLQRFDRPVVGMIDARRGEVYYGQSPCAGKDEKEWIGPTSVAPPEQVAASLPENAILVGSGAVLYENVFTAHCPTVQLADAVHHVIRAASVGMLASKRLAQDDCDSLDSLLPMYIRKSDAQIQKPIGTG